MSSRNTIRVLQNGALYAAGHDAQQDDARIPTFTIQPGATDTFRVDWTGFLGGASPSVSWTTTGGTRAGEAVSGSVASMRLSGLTEGEYSDVTCTATATDTVGVARFRVWCPQITDYSGGF